MARGIDERSFHPAAKELFGCEVIARIGRGAGAKIYAVRERVTNVVFALKHVKRKKQRDIRYVEQLQNELKMGQLIRHDGVRRPISIRIVRTLFRRVTEAALFVEYVEGMRLADVTNLRVWEILLVFGRVARALAAMHQVGVLHCDLKPSNILLTPSRYPKLIDLGQACRVGSTKKRIQGTPDFMAPEQVHRKVLTEKTDVFGFGATLYWTLTGRVVPTAMTGRKKKNQLVTSSIIPTPTELNPVVPQAVSDLVMTCIQQDPGRRPASMSSIAEVLETIGEEARNAYEARLAASGQ